MIYQFFLY